MDCPTDSAGFHVGDDGLRITKRDGRDAYAYTCTACGTVGDIVDGWYVPRPIERCTVCDMTCSACAMRPPEFDTPDGPACGTCVANAVFGGPEVIETLFTNHDHEGDNR